MAIDIETERRAGTVEQRVVYESGNEMAAYAASQINYHIMGYFPISPSTEVAQFLDLMKANGQHDIKLIPSDGEHRLPPGFATVLPLPAGGYLTRPARKAICICWSKCRCSREPASRWS